MKIAVNLLYLEYNTRSGVGKHIEDILAGFDKLNVLDEFYLIVRETFYNNYLSQIDAKQPFRNVHIAVCPEGRLIKLVIKRLKKGKNLARIAYLNRCVMPALLKDINPDIVFYPFNDATNNVFLKYPVVTVIHDLFYKNFPKQKRTFLNQLHAFYINVKHLRMLIKSKKIIAISEFVKLDILKHFPQLKSSNIVVIPNAVIISGETSVPGVIRKPFLLCVNEHGIHKNHLTLLKAFNMIKDSIPHRLVLLGNEREATPDIMKYIDDNNLRDRISLISNISDSALNWLYQNTDLFVTPSLHEGFGRTPIEAAMHGAMVLASRETSLPEVTCEMLNYYEPGADENALADKILELLVYPIPVEKREQIAGKLKELYDPVKIATLYYDLFYNIIHNNK